MDSSEEGGGSPLRRNEGVKYYTELLDSSSSVERECSEEGGGSPVRRESSKNVYLRWENYGGNYNGGKIWRV